MLAGRFRILAAPTARAASSASGASAAQRLAELEAQAPGNRLRVGKLQSLFAAAASPEDVPAMVSGLRLWDAQTNDINEETAALFVNQCLRVGAAKEAAEALADKELRVATWASEQAFERVVEACADAGEAEAAVAAVRAMPRVAFEPSPALLTTVLGACAEAGAADAAKVIAPYAQSLGATLDAAAAEALVEGAAEDCPRAGALRAMAGLSASGEDGEGEDGEGEEEEA